MEKEKLVFANWKMNVAPEEGVKLAAEIKKAKLPANVSVAVFPSFLSLPSVGAELGKSQIAIGAQDCFWAERGSFTGEISPAELADLGATYVLIGHSERRIHLGETSAMVNGKIKAALAAGLTPVLCIGESAEDRAAGKWPVVLERELKEGLDGVTLVGSTRIVVAYEPIWAIGTGKACGESEAVEAHLLIGNYLHEIFGAGRKEKHFPIIYGGSVDAGNIDGFFKHDEIAGALVGGASQKWPSMNALLKAIS